MDTFSRPLNQTITFFNYNYIFLKYMPKMRRALNVQTNSESTEFLWTRPVKNSLAQSKVFGRVFQPFIVTEMVL